MTGAAGFEKVYLERVPDELSHPKRAGREHLAVWRRMSAAAL